MALRDSLPFVNHSVSNDDSAVLPAQEASPSKDLPVKARAIRSKRNFGFFWGGGIHSTTRAQFEEADYNFKRIADAIDTDSYAKQAFGKYKDLFWKEGWTITGDNTEAVNYVWRRVDIIEKMMGQAFEDFLSEVSDQLVKYSNVFIGIARTDVRPMMKGFKGALSDDEASKMIAGFYIIPTEKVMIKRDKFNRPLQYAQKITDTVQTNPPADQKDIVWDAKDVIHLYLDRKPGRAFGTPFFESVMDDIISLRQMEENILNLVSRELFPLYLYKVGTEQYPSKEGELDEAIDAIENLKADGGLVAPFHHNVEVIGAGQVSIDAAPYLTHFKERVAIGLGVSPHHLGMMDGTSNRSVTERLDIALYDKIKNLQSYFENAMRINILNPLLAEGGFEASGIVSSNNVSDICWFEFNEIDIDTQIKKENHYTDLFAKDAISWEELRDKLKMDHAIDGENMYMLMQAKVQAWIASQTQTQPVSGGSQPSKPNAAKPAPKGQVNLPNVARGAVDTKNRPSNQHGRLQSPNIRNQMDRAEVFAENITELIGDNDD